MCGVRERECIISADKLINKCELYLSFLIFGPKIRREQFGKSERVTRGKGATDGHTHHFVRFFPLFHHKIYAYMRKYKNLSLSKQTFYAYFAIIKFS